VPGTLRLTRVGLGIELRRGLFEVTLDGKVVATLERGDTIEARLEPVSAMADLSVLGDVVRAERPDRRLQEPYRYSSPENHSQDDRRIGQTDFALWPPGGRRR
jgi:hypothetical protein